MDNLNIVAFVRRPIMVQERVIETKRLGKKQVNVVALSDQSHNVLLFVLSKPDVLFKSKGFVTVEELKLAYDKWADANDLRKSKSNGIARHIADIIPIESKQFRVSGGGRVRAILFSMDTLLSIGREGGPTDDDLEDLL